MGSEDCASAECLHPTRSVIVRIVGVQATPSLFSEKEVRENRDKISDAHIPVPVDVSLNTILEDLVAVRQ